PARIRPTSALASSGSNAIAVGSENRSTRVVPYAMARPTHTITAVWLPPPGFMSYVGSLPSLRQPEKAISRIPPLKIILHSALRTRIIRGSPSFWSLGLGAFLEAGGWRLGFPRLFRPRIFETNRAVEHQRQLLTSGRPRAVLIH